MITSTRAHQISRHASSIEVEPSPIAVRDLGLEVNIGGIFS